MMSAGLAESGAPQVGRFRVLGVVGAGGVGEVFSGHDPLLDRLVAIKRLRADRSRGADLRARLQEEARIAAKLSHPNIVTVYDFVHDGGADHIITEYVDGRSLRELTANGRPPLGRALQILVDVAEGLRCAHEHRDPIVHRDLKTENVLVGADGGVKITDFGISHSLGRGEPVATGQPSGTVRAMSPEQSLGLVTDTRSDLFSFGTMIYEVVAGVSPFEGRTPEETMERIRGTAHRPLSDWRPHVPIELARLVDRLLAKDAAERPRSIDEVLPILRRLAAEHRDERPDAQGVPEIERRQLAIVHLHAGASTFGDPEMVESIATFHRIVAEVAARLPATVIAAAGCEAVVAIGVPESHDNNAVRAAAFVAEVFARAGETAGALRAALDVGEAALVSTGAAPLVVGAVVDRAVRAGRASRAHDFVVGLAAHPLLARHLRLVARAARAGADQDGPLFEVVGALDDRAHAGELALVGRQRELAFLREEATRAGATAEGRALAIVGEAGIGKSRVVHELVRGAAPYGRWTLAHATPRLQFTPFAIVRTWVERLLDLEGEPDREARRARIGAFVAALEGGDDEIAAAVAHVCDVVEPRDLERLAAVPVRLRPTFVQDRIALLCVRIAERRPLALVVEDLHWLDHASLQVVDALVRRTPALPLFLLLSYRSEWRPPWADEVVEVVLRRMSEAESRELALRTATDRVPDGALVDAIVARAEGLPLVVEELTRAVLDGNARAADHVPTSLRDSVVARLQRLDAATRRVVDTAAVIGREVDADLLAAVLEISPDEVAARMEPVVRRGLLERRAYARRRGWAFGHVLTRDAVHDALDRARRVSIHAAVATVLERAVLEPRSGATLDQLAHHCEGAEDFPRAIELRLRSARRAAERFAHPLARAEYERALELLARTGGNDEREREIRGELAGPLGATLGWGAPEVERNAARLQSLVAGTGEELPWTALWQEWALGYVTGNMAIVSAAFGRLDDRLRREARGPAEAEERELLRYLLAGGRGAIDLHLGLLARAREHLVAARRQRAAILPQLDAFPQLEARLVPTAYLAWVELLVGDLEAAWRVLGEDETSAVLGAPAQLCAKSFAVPVALVARDWRAAEERARLVTTEGLELLTPHHVHVARFALRLVELRRLAEHGGATDLAELQRILDALDEHFEAWHGGFMRASIVVYPILVAEAAIDLAGREGTSTECRDHLHVHARACVNRSLGWIGAPDDEINRNFESEVHRVHAEVLAAEGRRPEARTVLAEARAAAEFIGRLSGRPASFLDDRIAETAARLESS